MGIKMKELEARTGVSREAIRFYIREGLLPAPDKPKRNVALYSEEHVRRTRLIKTLQDKHYLPLKMVKAVLDSPDGKTLTESPGLKGMVHFLPALLQDTHPGPERDLAEVAADTGLGEEEIRKLAGVGGITLRQGDRLDFRDVAILETWAQARHAGFDESHGYDEKFFAIWVEQTQQLADFAVDRFVSAYAELDAQRGAALGAQGINVANRIISLLHTKFIVSALAARTNPDADVNR